MPAADTSSIDDFLNAFRSQVDGGFGLISGDIKGVFGVLIVISIGSTALMWVIDETHSVSPQLVRKVLLVGFFAWLIDQWQTLTTSVVQGFAALGLKAGGGSLAVDDFMSSPSKVVSDGFTDVVAILSYIGTLSQQGYGVGFFAHFDVILISSVCAIGLMISFIILAVEIAVTIIEFHIVTLIAFVTVPFGVLSQTAFLSDRAIGYVVSIGLKLMALAIVVSIGETVFKSYAVSPAPTAGEECGLLLSAVLMLVLALKIPAIAGGLVSGGPQLTAGSAIAGVGSIAAAVGLTAVGGRVAGLIGEAGRGLSAKRSSSVETALAAAGLSESLAVNGRGSRPTAAPPPGPGAAASEERGAAHTPPSVETKLEDPV